jgi:hypothetical protein
MNNGISAFASYCNWVSLEKALDLDMAARPGTLFITLGPSRSYRQWGVEGGGGRGGGRERERERERAPAFKSCLCGRERTCPSTLKAPTRPKRVFTASRVRIVSSPLTPAQETPHVLPKSGYLSRPVLVSVGFGSPPGL